MRVIGWAFVLVVPHCIDNQIEAALQQQQLDRHIKNPGGSGVSKIEAVLQQQLDRVIENEGGVVKSSAGNIAIVSGCNGSPLNCKECK